jgi:excisionase family DNA binding protein
VSPDRKTEKEEYYLSAAEMREWVRIHEALPDDPCTETTSEISRELHVKAGRPASKVHSARDRCVDRDIFSLSTGEYLVELPASCEPLKENHFAARQPGCCGHIPALVEGVRDLVAVLSTNTSATVTVDTSETFGVIEAARRLGCSTKTIHKLCHEKRLAFHWVGNKRRFRPEDISRFFGAQTEITKTQGPSGVDEKRGSRLRFSGSFAAGRSKKGGEKGRTKGTSNGTETEILASIRERMREWD